MNGIPAVSFVFGKCNIVLANQSSWPIARNELVAALNTAKLLTLLWYHGVNMTPGLFDRLNIPNFEIISFHLALYFLCSFLSTVSIHSISILMLPFLYILHFICLRSY